VLALMDAKECRNDAHALLRVHTARMKACPAPLYQETQNNQHNPLLRSRPGHVQKVSRHAHLHLIPRKHMQAKIKDLVDSNCQSGRAAQGL
jgi:hypothetical protein